MPYIRPFSNGSEADVWVEANCERCWRVRDDDPNDMPSCPISAAITQGYISGKISIELARRAGYTDNRMPTRCAEFNTVDPDKKARDMERLRAWNAQEPIRSVQ